MYFCPPVQYPNTSVRLQMEDAATCVFYPPVGNTNVLVPQIFTWPLTIRPASPTAPPVRSATFLFPPASKLCLNMLFHFNSDQYFSPKGKLVYFRMLSSYYKYCRYSEMAVYWFRLWLWRMLKLKRRVKYSCWLQILCFLLSMVLIVSLWDRWVYPFLVEVWHGGWLWGRIWWTDWLPWVPCFSEVGFKIVLESQLLFRWALKNIQIELEQKRCMFLSSVCDCLFTLTSKWSPFSVVLVVLVYMVSI